MSALLLARIQFAFTVGFHFLFPAMTLGTALIILISETLYLIKKDEVYKKILSQTARANIYSRCGNRHHYGVFLWNELVGLFQSSRRYLRTNSGC
jgi:hypothetical protein